MTRANRRVRRWAGLLAAALPLGGCTLASDLLDPQFVLGLGLDPATVTPQQGIILVALNNTTGRPAYLNGYFVVDAGKPSRGSRNFTVYADPGEVRNEVLECPIAVLGPGQLEGAGDEVTVNASAAAIVLTGDDGTTTDVAYSGPPAYEGTAFACGDVVEFRLVQATGGRDQTEATYAVTVRVIPGR